VFCDSCVSVFYSVGWYRECKKIHDMNNVTIVRNSHCNHPHPPPTGVDGSQTDNHCAVSHMCNIALHSGTAHPVLVASYMHSNTQQTVTGNCVTDTHWLCTRGCLMTGAVYSGVLRHVTTSHS
jgi:hypothetical protein